MNYLINQFGSVASFSLLLTIVVYSIAYFTILRRKKYTLIKCIIQIIFIFYIFVVLTSVWSGLRFGGGLSRANFIPFSSFQSALSTIGLDKGYPMAVNQIILNILMFAPFGFMLPIINKKFNSFLKVLCLSFGFTLIIETVQLIFPIGRSFDTDDLICNTLGSILGYCLYILSSWIYSKLTKKESRYAPRVLAFSTGILLLSLILPTIYFLQYHFSEYGRVYLAFSQMQLDSNVELKVDLPESENLNIYQLKKYDEKALMAELIEKFDMKSEPYYQDERFYNCKDEDEGKYLTINLESDRWSYLLNNKENTKEDLSYDRRVEFAKTFLQSLGIYEGLFLPKDNQEHINTSQVVYFNKQNTEKVMYDGNISVTVDDDSLNYSTFCNIREFEYYKTIETSPKESYENIIKGKVAFDCEVDEVDKVVINELAVEYRYEANKELYIPIYCFKGLAYKDGNTYDIKLFDEVTD